MSAAAHARGQASGVADWPAARHFPDTYPGECPPGSFVIVDDRVYDLDGPPSALVVADGTTRQPLDDLLAARGLPLVKDRVPVIAYGGNRNPGTITIKCSHYGYRSPGTGNVFPAIHARLRGLDIVGAGLTDQGYLYADIHQDELTADTEVEVWVLLLDRDGLRMMHDSEGVRAGAYAVARLDGLRVAGSDRDLPAFCYAGMLPVFRSPEHGTPLAYATVAATNRLLPALDATAMVDHMIHSLGLDALVTELTGIPAGPDLGAELMKFLNGQFWYRRHTARRRVEGCERLEAAVWKALATTWAPTGPGARLQEQGATIDTDTAYDAPAGYTVGQWWAEGG